MADKATIGYLGYALREVLEGQAEIHPVSPKDLVGDIHHAAATLEDHLKRWEILEAERGWRQEGRVAHKLLPIIRQLKKATEDKGKVVFDD